MQTQTLQDLYLKELRDLYGSEKQLSKWLPKIADRAETPELRRALANHLSETRGHASRLEKIFQNHNEKAAVKNGKDIEGIPAEAEDDIADCANPALRDAAIVAACQQIEHYEIAAYGTLQTYALHLGHADSGKMLEQILEEERGQARKLADIATNYLKVEITRTA